MAFSYPQKVHCTDLNVLPQVTSFFPNFLAFLQPCSDPKSARPSSLSLIIQNKNTETLLFHHFLQNKFAQSLTNSKWDWRFFKTVPLISLIHHCRDGRHVFFSCLRSVRGRVSPDATAGHPPRSCTRLK